MAEGRETICKMFQMMRGLFGEFNNHRIRNISVCTAYRVTLVVAHLGWVNYDFGHSTVCLVLLGQMGIWHNWLYSWARCWTIHHLSQPNQGA